MPESPKMAKYILKLYFGKAKSEELEGDLDEVFQERAEKSGIFRARLMYWVEVMGLILAFMFKRRRLYEYFDDIIMWNNYLKLTFRNFLRSKGYSLINISGLAIGITCCILILIYVKDELRYDKYHEESQRIYRLTTISNEASANSHYASSPAPAYEFLLEDFPQIENASRFIPTYGFKFLIKRDQKKFYEDSWAFVDTSFTEIFSIEGIDGNLNKALEDPLSLIITEKMADKYFEDLNPVNKFLEVDMFGSVYNFRITAVVKNWPENSHINPDFIASFNFIENLGEDELNGYRNYVINWQNSIVFTYILLKEGVAPEHLESQFPEFVEKHMGKDEIIKTNFKLQSLTDIYLFSDLENEVAKQGNVQYIYIFSAIAVMVLLIACINFMNLATARSSKRAVEIGMRKVLGAYRRQMVQQFIGESIIMSFTALLVALAICGVILPLFSNLVGRTFTLESLFQVDLIVGFVVIALLTGFLSGSYPAFYLSKYNPVRALKHKMSHGKGSAAFLRKMLVILQFMVSVVLLVGTGVVQSQLSFIQNKNLGFNKEETILIPIREPRMQQKYEEFKKILTQNAGIISAATSSFYPGQRTFGKARFYPEGREETDEFIGMEILTVDHDFIETMEIKMKEGRSFSKDFPSDASSSFIINEAAAEELGWDNAVGKELDFHIPAPTESGWASARVGKIIGVIEDFHYKSFHQPIEPLVMTIYPQWFGHFLIKIKTSDLQATVDYIENSWKKLSSGLPFEYQFLDQQFNKLYKFERRVSSVFHIFSGLAIFIACLGLFGLASFIIEQRTKEIGVRKVMGASIPGIIGLLSRDFIMLVLGSMVIGFPVAYLVMEKWLQGFAYRTNISLTIFILSGLVAIIIAVLTVSFQSIKAATSNPVKALRYE